MTDLPQLNVLTSSGNTAKAAIDVDIVTVYETGKKPTLGKSLERYQSILDKLVQEESFNAEHGTFRFVRFGGLPPSKNLLLVGLGSPGKLSLERVRQVAGKAAAQLKNEKCYSACLQTGSLVGQGDSLSPSQMVRAFCEGFSLNHQQFDSYKSAQPSKVKKPISLAVSWANGTASGTPSVTKEILKHELDQVEAVLEAVRVTRVWSNEPSNKGTPEYYAQEARKLATKHGLKIKVLKEDEALKEKMGLFLGVGQGSERENRLVVVEYNPPAKGAGGSKTKGKARSKTIALVGKGVTFDSGGISIKGALRMEDMKHDMTGAATVMGAILLAAQWKVPHRVIAVMAFAENMPDGKAIQPGNILTSRSGKTVEILNTDAEGRLVLADALDFVQDYNPDVIVDVATLTGAVSIALGKQCCGILGNHQPTIDALRAAGDHCGERIWQLPLFDEYLDDLKSDYADLKNSVNDSNGGTIRGAMFLKQFIRKDMKWAHLDIAGTAYNMGHVPYFPKYGASGAYVRTLAQFIAEYELE